ncbi:hypothetical protein RhiirA5_405266 [Rhizophagus irregularis]|uniref:Uncharacterized protein n=1 Tax=Rhizophagus irregularis TaxID=588596 RepID=A0A2N0QFU6_9GLOM|nr:hypothetical protein RhiirA5_405266 [Rhizophagus irregularis]
MSHSIANTSTSISASRLPTVEEINGWKSSNYNKINTFEISCDTIVEDKEIVEWFANLNLFSWIHQKGNNIILYLNNKKELNVAKEWIVRKHKEISI